MPFDHPTSVLRLSFPPRHCHSLFLSTSNIRQQLCNICQSIYGQSWKVDLKKKMNFSRIIHRFLLSWLPCQWKAWRMRRTSHLTLICDCLFFQRSPQLSTFSFQVSVHSFFYVVFWLLFNSHYIQSTARHPTNPTVTLWLYPSSKPVRILCSHSNPLSLSVLTRPCIS